MHFASWASSAGKVYQAAGQLSRNKSTYSISLTECEIEYSMTCSGKWLPQHEWSVETKFVPESLPQKDAIQKVESVESWLLQCSRGRKRADIHNLPGTRPIAARLNRQAPSEKPLQQRLQRCWYYAFCVARNIIVGRDSMSKSIPSNSNMIDMPPQSSIRRTKRVAFPSSSKSQRWTLILLIICGFQQRARCAEEASAETPTILAHPAMFGKRWLRIVTVVLRTIDADLCNETIADGVDSNNFGSTDDLYDTAMLYVDPVLETGKEKCSYAEMAQATEKLYPAARHLLISRSGLVAMKKDDDSPDTNLALASVTYEDAAAIHNMVSDDDQNRTSLTADGIVVSIDAVSRCFIDDGDSEYTAEDAKLWMIFLRVSSGLSLVGSIYVFCSLIGTKKSRSEKMGLLFNRLLLRISIFDILSSITMLLGSWPMQSSPPGDYEGNISQTWWDASFPGAAGNKMTCTLQGFFLQVGVLGESFFTSFVAVQTLLVVRYAWTNQQMRKAEIAFNTVGIGLPLITGIWAAASDRINNLAVGFCWISMTPRQCKNEMGGPLFDEYCDNTVRVESALAYQIGLAMVWAFLTLLVIAYSMISLFCFVRKREKQASRWMLTSQRGQQQKKVLVRATMYITGYVGIWIPTFISLQGDLVARMARMSLVAALLPLQGFLNALIYSGVVDRCLLRTKEMTNNSQSEEVSSNITQPGQVRDIDLRSETLVGQRGTVRIYEA
eukprot:scaffold22607_cov123-Cylindrotheca_fusiformis.AAC.16